MYVRGKKGEKKERVEIKGARERKRYREKMKYLDQLVKVYVNCPHLCNPLIFYFLIFSFLFVFCLLDCNGLTESSNKSMLLLVSFHTSLFSFPPRDLDK